MVGVGETGRKDTARHALPEGWHFCIQNASVLGGDALGKFDLDAARPLTRRRHGILSRTNGFWPYARGSPDHQHWRDIEELPGSVMSAVSVQHRWKVWTNSRMWRSRIQVQETVRDRHRCRRRRVLVGLTPPDDRHALEKKKATNPVAGRRAAPMNIFRKAIKVARTGTAMLPIALMRRARCWRGRLAKKISAIRYTSGITRRRKLVTRLPPASQLGSTIRGARGVHRQACPAPAPEKKAWASSRRRPGAGLGAGRQRTDPAEEAWYVMPVGSVLGRWRPDPASRAGERFAGRAAGAVSPDLDQDCWGGMMNPPAR